MNSSTSTLNPNAASYVPLFKREVINEDKYSKTMLGKVAVSDSHLTVNDDKLKGQQADAADGLSSEEFIERDNKYMDEDSEMDLAYLQMMFPGVSDQSLADVYAVNLGDLDSAVDMLTDLEVNLFCLLEDLAIWYNTSATSSFSLLSDATLLALHLIFTSSITVIDFDFCHWFFLVCSRLIVFRMHWILNTLRNQFLQVNAHL